MDKDMKAKAAAVDMLLQILSEVAPDEEKPIYVMPQIQTKLMNTTARFMKVALDQKTDADKRKFAREAVTILEDAQETFTAFFASTKRLKWRSRPCLIMAYMMQNG